MDLNNSHFKRFFANSAFYYCMVISFFLFECFKEDVLYEVMQIVNYATTVRRKVLAFAAKIAKTRHEKIFKITTKIMKKLNFMNLWDKCLNPPPI